MYTFVCGKNGKKLTQENRKIPVKTVKKNNFISIHHLSVIAV